MEGELILFMDKIQYSISITGSMFSFNVMMYMKCEVTQP